MHYADMKKDIKASIARIANFLDIDVDSDRIKDVEKNISMTAMRKAAKTYVPDNGGPVGKVVQRPLLIRE